MHDIAGFAHQGQQCFESYGTLHAKLYPDAECVSAWHDAVHAYMLPDQKRKQDLSCWGALQCLCTCSDLLTRLHSVYK